MVDFIAHFEETGDTLLANIGKVYFASAICTENEIFFPRYMIIYSVQSYIWDRDIYADTYDNITTV